MFEILFIIIVSIIIYKRVQAAKRNDEPKNAPSLPPVIHTGRPAKNILPHNAKTRTQQTPQTPIEKTAIEEAKEDGNSTTAYLMEKAEADAREHAREKYEEQKRLYETRGGLAVAERHFDGDPIPRERKCVKCGYCGAENLLPMIPRTRYSCYFCREAL